MAASKVVQRRLTIKKFQKQLRLRGKPGLWKGLDAVLRHPLALLLMGFALTGVIGGHIQNRQNDIEKESIKVVAAQDGVQKIQQAIDVYVVRANLIWIRHYNGHSDTQALLSNVDDAMVAASSTVMSQAATIERPFSFVRHIDDRKAGRLDKLADFLFTSRIELEAILEKRIDKRSPDLPYADVDAIKVYLFSVQICALLLLHPFEEALTQSDTRSRDLLFESDAREISQAEKTVVWSSPHPKGFCPVNDDDPIK